MSPSRSEGGLYLHVPFCSGICPYCDFAVWKRRPERHAAFVERLRTEIRSFAGFDLGFDTIYFGGGTPSILTPDHLAGLIDTARESLTIDPAARIALEANPEDVSLSSVQAWRDLGVDMVSLGVQSFQPAVLRFLGRRHDATQSTRSFQIARDAGFPIVSLDLIFGLPGQTVDDLGRDLDRVAELGPVHVSCYQLTVHEGTHFGRRRADGRLEEAPEDAQADLFLLLHERLADMGIPAYEVSNFARSPEHRSRHNPKYWRHVPYLGLGPSAHSYRDGERWWNVRDLDAYEARIDAGRSPVQEREALSAADLALEAVMLELRTVEGLDFGFVEELSGLSLLPRNRLWIENDVELGLLRWEGERLVATRQGMAVVDRIVRQFEIDVRGSRPE